METLARFFGACLRVLWQCLRMRRVFVSTKVRDARLDVCRACPYVSISSTPEFSTCTVCGCLVAAKASLTTEKCPKDLWPR